MDSLKVVLLRPTTDRYKIIQSLDVTKTFDAFAVENKIHANDHYVFIHSSLNLTPKHILSSFLRKLEVNNTIISLRIHMKTRGRNIWETAGMTSDPLTSAIDRLEGRHDLRPPDLSYRQVRG